MKIEKIKLSWLWPAQWPCGAKTRAGTPCKNWAMVNGRCKFHGGKSTGPRTLKGKINSSTANFKHGRHSFELQKQRAIKRLIKVIAIKNGKLPSTSEVKMIVESISEMSFKEFKDFKYRLQDFVYTSPQNKNISP